MGWSFVVSLVFLFSLSIVSATIPDDCHKNMTAYWKFDSNAHDSYASYNGNNWVDNAELVVGAGVLEEGAAKFSGTDSISISDRGSNEIGLSETGSTVQFWFKDGVGASGTLVEKAGGYKIEWNYESTTGEGNITATYGDVVATTANFNAIDYNHMVTVTDNRSQLAIYIDDGKTIDVVSVYAGNTFPPSTKGTDLVIGGGDGFKGIIDELAMYDKALEPYEIRAAYDKSSGGQDYCHNTGSKKTSSTRTNFSIDGCYFEEANFGLTAGTCSRNGRYYCHGKDEGYDTIQDYGGCDRAGTVDADGTESCCPSGYVCQDKDASGDPLPELGNKCVQITVDCAGRDQGDCEDEARCIWVVGKDGGFCTGHLADYGCSFYESISGSGNAKTACEEDFYNLGSTGVGTDKCGAYIFNDTVMDVAYLIPPDSCHCEWKDSKCNLAYSFVPDIHDGHPANFTCYKDFTTGDCVDGFQYLNWTTTSANSTAFNDLVNDTKKGLLISAGCVDGGDKRSCGDPLVKLPFFSLVSIALCVLIFAGYYLRKVYKEDEVL